MDSFVDEIPIYGREEGRKSRRIVALSCCLTFLVLLPLSVGVIMLVIPDTAKSVADVFGKNPKCEESACTLSIITVLKSGESHPCKQFCSKLLDWKHSISEPLKKNDVYGSYKRHGICREREDLTLNAETSLIPTTKISDLGTVPNYEHLLKRLSNIDIVMIGDSVLRQVFEILPSLLNDTSFVLEDVAYEYLSQDTVKRIRKCDVQFSEKSQTCLHHDSKRELCNCTTVTQWHSIKTGTTVQFAWGYGIDFPLIEKDESDSDGPGVVSRHELYGSSFNLVHPALYSQLARSADAIVTTSNVVPHATTHDADGYFKFLNYLKDLDHYRDVIFLLTLPQHFHVTNVTDSTDTNVTIGDGGAGYLDEERLHGHNGCSALNAKRHWTDKIARDEFRGSKVDVIDMYPIMADRGEFHSLVKGDCSQWCLGYELMYPFWDAISELLGADVVET
eukprot:CAMPEP_0194240520 /NCGR_PEP_ID=MMETSP0158-20130606/6664_1 /TAXON_ID=33649 /ORGANISM="Thalassionema nitzschioides, Strain L26-B" /LENGTH=447 /DNA_ID=CAMNT_0038975231 /DNA_START=36 /DNA_END=1379 /DNA_ORIENTATION=-